MRPVLILVQLVAKRKHHQFGQDVPSNTTTIWSRCSFKYYDKSRFICSWKKRYFSLFS